MTSIWKPSFDIDFSGSDKDELIHFEEGLKHTILYDIETHSGELSAYSSSVPFSSKSPRS